MNNLACVKKSGNPQRAKPVFVPSCVYPSAIPNSVLSARVKNRTSRKIQENIE